MGSSGSVDSTKRFLDQALNQVNKSNNRLASGKRINSAADDAAGLAIADALGVTSKLSDVANRNIGDAQSALAIQDGALSTVSDISSRLKELAAESANGTLSDSQRASLGSEFNALKDEVSRITQTTQFNGQQLLSGSSSTTFQVGTDSSANSQIAVSTSGFSTAAASIQSLDISTQGGAQSALGSLDNFIQTVADTRGSAGAVDSRLSSASANNSSTKVNTAAAESRIRDVDVADEVAKRTSADILANAGVAIISHQGLQANIVLNLLK